MQIIALQWRMVWYGAARGTAEVALAVQAPIVASREPDATEAEVQRGTEQSNELSAIVNNFILRRTNALLSAHLPPKVPEPSSTHIAFPFPAQHGMQSLAYSHRVRYHAAGWDGPCDPD